MGLKRVGGEVAAMDASIRWKGPLVSANDFCGDYSLGFGDIDEET
jgi:hypothetical protein